MSDERWEQIFASKLHLTLPGIAPKARLLSPEPTCQEHCSGRHEHDGWIQCSRCGGRLSRVILHEFAHRAGHYFIQLDPPQERFPSCCGHPMTRVMR